MRELLLVAGIAASGLPGLLPGERGGDPQALLVWLALVAAPCGALARAAGLRLLPHALAVPGAWALLLAAAGAAQMRDLATPSGAMLVIGALFCGGHALGARGSRAAWLFGAALLLGFAPSFGLLADMQTPAFVSKWLLQLSPVVSALAAGGVDALRHPLVYDSASVADLPSDWTAWSEGALARASAFVLTFTAAWLAERRAASARTDAPGH